MKARWPFITLLLAFLFAFAFFLSEARLGHQPAARALAIPPAPATALSDIRPIGPMSPAGPISETPAPTPAPAIATPQATETKPALLSGTVTREDNALIYDADARLELAKNLILSSPTGVMVSDEKQKIFAGDMQIEAGENTITAHEGILDTNTHQMKATVASIAFTNDQNQLIRMTGENVTLELPTADKKSPTPNTILADSVTVESPAAPSSTPKP